MLKFLTFATTSLTLPVFPDIINGRPHIIVVISLAPRSNLTNKYQLQATESNKPVNEMKDLKNYKNEVENIKL